MPKMSRKSLTRDNNQLLEQNRLERFFLLHTTHPGQRWVYTPTRKRSLVQEYLDMVLKFFLDLGLGRRHLELTKEFFQLRFTTGEYIKTRRRIAELMRSQRHRLKYIHTKTQTLNNDLNELKNKKIISYELADDRSWGQMGDWLKGHCPSLESDEGAESRIGGLVYFLDRYFLYQDSYILQFIPDYACTVVRRDLKDIDFIIVERALNATLKKLVHGKNKQQKQHIQAVFGVLFEKAEYYLNQRWSNSIPLNQIQDPELLKEIKEKHRVLRALGEKADGLDIVQSHSGLIYKVDSCAPATNRTQKENCDGRAIILLGSALRIFPYSLNKYERGVPV